jgi:DNA repair ATPase RecN
MIDTLKIFEELKETMEENSAKKLTEIIGMLYQDLQNTVTKTEFKELRDIVKELSEAQKRTGLRVEELAEAQKRTELRVEELAEAQKKTESRVEELAEAQKRTESRVEELAEAQKRTELRVEELAEAQKKTENELRILVKDHKETKRQVGGLSMTVGYTLEDAAYKSLPTLLKRDFGIVVKDRLKRLYLTDNKGYDIEINIFAEASKNGKEIIIIGEAKSQLSKKDINNFIRRKLNRVVGVYKEVFPILITYMTTSRDVEKYAKEKGIGLYYSYDL